MGKLRGLAIVGVLGLVMSSTFAGTGNPVSTGPLNIPVSETQIVYQNAKMKSCITGKDSSGNPNAVNFCPNSLLPSASIPAQGGFTGTSIAEIGLYNAAGDRLDGFFDCKMKRVAAAIPDANNSPDACVRVRCGYMGSCAAGAPTCPQHDIGAVVCQMYGLRTDKTIANIGTISVTPIPTSQINSGCTVTQSSFDCTTTAGYDPTKTYYISGLDPTTCRPVCVIAGASTGSKVWSRDSANDGACVSGSQNQAYRCVDTNGCDPDKPVIGLPAGPSGGTTTLSVACSVPTFTEVSNTDTGPGGIRTQAFAVGATVNAGSVYQVMVYSHGVSVTAVAGDTPSTIVNKLVTAINATTAAQWNSAGSAPAPGTNGFKPSATSSGSDTVVIKLNFVNQFGANVTP